MVVPDMRSFRAAITPIAIAASIAITIAATPGCSSGDDDAGPPVDRLRDAPDEALLQRVALDGAYCVLTSVEEAGEGELDGNTGYAAQTYFEVVDGRQQGNNLSVSIDHFPDPTRASHAALSAGGDLAELVGAGSTDVGPLDGHPGSASYAAVVTDFEGRPRGAFAAAVPVDTTVVRVGSFGISEIADYDTFTAVTEQLIEGLIGDAEVAAVPPCTS